MAPNGSRSLLWYYFRPHLLLRFPKIPRLGWACVLLLYRCVGFELDFDGLTGLNCYVHGSEDRRHAFP